MAIYPRGQRFMASVGSGEGRVRKTFKTLGEAQAWEQAQKPATGPFKALPEAVPAGPQCWTLQQAFINTLSKKWKGTPGEAKAVLNAQQAVDYFGPDTPCSAITTHRVAEYMTHLDVALHNAGGTRNRKLSALSLMLHQAVRYGNLASLPIMDRAAEAEHRTAWFKEQDEATMLATCARLGLTELADFIVVAIDTGFRRTELLSLVADDPELDKLTVYETKNGKPRSVPCSARVKAIITPRAGQKVFPTMTEATLRHQWDALRHHMGRADDPDFIVHVLRHTCATRLVQKGIHLADVRMWMGHSSIDMTMKYAHHSVDHLKRARDQMEGRA